MTINAHISTFAGLPVQAYPADTVPADPGAVAWRIEDPDFEGGDVFLSRLSDLVAEEWAGQVTALILGEWGSAYDSPPPLDYLAAALPQLTNLKALFVGEMTFEECEISWINHGDITPLLTALPALEIFTIRGSVGLELKPIRHESLRRLTFESGGLGGDLVRTVSDCDLPRLEHLELWLGTENYGGNAIVDDLAVILTGSRLPALTSLGLRDAEIADQVAVALASAPVIARLEALDLSLGMLSDVGASALLAGQPLTHLRTLDLHHHFLSVPMIARLGTELRDAGVDLDLSDAEDPDDPDARYVAVAE
jgi:hypothetical protein